MPPDDQLTTDDEDSERDWNGEGSGSGDSPIPITDPPGKRIFFNTHSRWIEHRNQNYLSFWKFTRNQVEWWVEKLVLEIVKKLILYFEKKKTLKVKNG